MLKGINDMSNSFEDIFHFSCLQISVIESWPTKPTSKYRRIPLELTGVHPCPSSPLSPFHTRSNWQGSSRPTPFSCITQLFPLMTLWCQQQIWFYIVRTYLNMDLDISLIFLCISSNQLDIFLTPIWIYVKMNLRYL